MNNYFKNYIGHTPWLRAVTYPIALIWPSINEAAKQHDKDYDDFKNVFTKSKDTNCLRDLESRKLKSDVDMLDNMTDSMGGTIDRAALVSFMMILCFTKFVPMQFLFVISAIFIGHRVFKYFLSYAIYVALRVYSTSYIYHYCIKEKFKMQDK